MNGFTSIKATSMHVFGAVLRRWVLFSIKSALLLGAFVHIGLVAPFLPAWAIMLAFVVLGSFLAISVAYPRVMDKTLKVRAYSDGAIATRLANGRLGTIVAGVVVGTFLAASLIFSVSTWHALEWGLAFASIPIYILVSMVVSKVLGAQYDPFYRAGHLSRWSGIATAGVLCAVYLVASMLLPHPTYEGIMAAYEAMPQPFASSSSPALAELGMFFAFQEGVTNCAVEALGQTSAVAANLWELALTFSSLCAVAGVLNVCVLPLREVRKVFLPIRPQAAPEGIAGATAGAGADAGIHGRAGSHTSSQAAPVEGDRIVGRFVVYAIACPLALFALLVPIERAASEAVCTEGYVGAKALVWSHVETVAYQIDGMLVAKDGADAVYTEALASIDALEAGTRAQVIDLINASYDQRIANVDSYLDWYYSLAGDYQRLGTMIIGTAEDFVADQFASYIEAGIDDTPITEALAAYGAERQQIVDGARSELAAYQVDIPAQWVTVVDGGPVVDFFDPDSTQVDGLLDSAGRAGITVASTAAGVAGGVVTGKAVTKAASPMAEKLVQKALGKELAQKLVARITSVVGSKAVGAAIGGAAGVIAGPLGVVAGTAAGTAIGVGVDQASIMIEEAFERDAVRQEIVGTIEEQRAETLSMFEAEPDIGTA